MDFLNNINIAQASFTLLATFGTVSAVTFWKKDLESNQKFLLSVAVAFIFGFVPADLGNLLANKIKEAISIAVALNGAYQFISGVVKKIGSGTNSPQL